jgi:PEP-CTERM motif
LRNIANNFTFRPVFVAIASLFVAHSATFAADLTATGSSQLGSNPAFSLSQGSPFSVDVVDFSSASPDSSIFHSYGSAWGNFGSRSSGYGTYNVSSAFGLVDTITNFSSAAQHVSFTFNITPGMLNNEVMSTLSGDQFVSSGINFNIQRNGSSVWGSSATLTTNTAGTTFTQTGANLYIGQVENPTHYRIDGLSQTVDLGILNAGESLELRYDLSTFAKGNTPSGPDRVVAEHTFVVPEQWVDFCGGECGYGYGYGNNLVPGTTVTIPAYTIPGAPSGSHASSGDPFTFTLDGGITPQFGGVAVLPRGVMGYEVGFTPITAAVPEPTTTALMFLGLGVLGATVQRRRRNNAL